MIKITIYTDGSSKGNPGAGGWGAIIFDEEKVLEIGGNEENTTNNRMEMMAAIKALELAHELTHEQIEINTDSEYLLKGITIWIHDWQKNGWRTKAKKEVLNKDLWEELWELTQKRKVEWKKVLGHSGHELNERCDEIATTFADGNDPVLYNGLKSSYNRFHPIKN